MLGPQIRLGLSTNPRNRDGYCRGDKVKALPVIFLEEDGQSCIQLPHLKNQEKFLSGLYL